MHPGHRTEEDHQVWRPASSPALHEYHVPRQLPHSCLPCDTLPGPGGPPGAAADGQRGGGGPAAAHADGGGRSAAGGLLRAQQRGQLTCGSRLHCQGWDWPFVHVGHDVLNLGACCFSI